MLYNYQFLMFLLNCNHVKYKFSPIKHILLAYMTLMSGSCLKRQELVPPMTAYDRTNRCNDLGVKGLI